MRRGPKLKAIELTVEEHNRLLEWTRRQKTSQALALRARIVLASQQPLSNGEIARELRVTRGTVGKWRARFTKARLEGLLDEPINSLFVPSVSGCEVTSVRVIFNAPGSATSV